MFYDEMNPIHENAIRNSSRISAHFADSEAATQAMSELQQRGFSVELQADEQSTTVSTDPGLNRGVADPEAQHSSYTRRIKGFWGEHGKELLVESSASELGREQELYAGTFRGGATITVNGGSSEEARRLLERCGGELGEQKPSPREPAA